VAELGATIGTILGTALATFLATLSAVRRKPADDATARESRSTITPGEPGVLARVAALEARFAADDKARDDKINREIERRTAEALRRAVEKIVSGKPPKPTKETADEGRTTDPASDPLG